MSEVDYDVHVFRRSPPPERFLMDCAICGRRRQEPRWGAHRNQTPDHDLPVCDLCMFDGRHGMSASHGIKVADRRAIVAGVALVSAIHWEVINGPRS